MNTKLIDKLRLDAGIARLGDWDKAMICVGRDGKAIEPLVGLGIFADLIVKECLQIVENEFWSDPHEVYIAMDLIRERFGVK